MLSDEAKRRLARAAVAGCMLLIVVLVMVGFGGDEFTPTRLLVDGVTFVGMAYNAYFLYRWLNALTARRPRAGATWFIGVAWIAFTSFAALVAFVLSYGRCAGGCGNGGVASLDWLFMVSTWAIGIGFNRWLDSMNPSA